MPPDELTPDAAWRALCGARRRLRDPGAEAPASGIDFAADGTWEARGAISPDARDLLDRLAPLVAAPGPLVIAQLGQSMDGRIATASGHSHYINGFESRVHLHRLRALVDAVVIGAGAAVADDPRLTVRHVDGPQPLRVVLDPAARVPDDTHLLRSGDAPTLHVVSDRTGVSEPANGHVRRVPLICDADGRFPPGTVLDALARQGLTRVLIEGGGVTVSWFLDAGALDRLHLLVAPLLIGSGRPGISTAPIDTLDDALRPGVRRFDLGADTLFDLNLA